MSQLRVRKVQEKKMFIPEVEARASHRSSIDIDCRWGTSMRGTRGGTRTRDTLSSSYLIIHDVIILHLPISVLGCQ